MYFKIFPAILYDSKGDGNFKIVTNLLRRVAVRTKVKTNTAIFDIYDVKEGESPESIAWGLYGDVDYHWIILLMNDITDRYHEWPLSTPQFLSFLNEKYSDPNGTHHYEISQTSGETTTKINIGTSNADYPTATEVTNFEYEESEQDKKRQIRLLHPSYLGLFIEEFKSLMTESTY
jgi:hypothetical protein